MGFTALGGLSAVLISKESISEAVSAGGMKMLVAIFIFFFDRWRKCLYS